MWKALCVLLLSLTSVASNEGSAIQNMWFNTLKCGEVVCEPEIRNYSVPTFTRDYSRDIAKFSADLVARLIIDKDSASVTLPEGLTLLGKVYNFEEHPIFGIIAKDNHDTVWIAYRGTDNLVELVEDLFYGQFYQTAFTAEFPEAKCHIGFLAVYSKFKRDVRTFTANYTNIVISGYSLGGAIATLTGFDLRHKNVVVNTFASPMVGNKAFAEEVDLHLPLYRHINTCDIIHNLPTSVSPNFIHPENPIFYQHCGEPVTFTDNWLSVTNNHNIAVYLENV